MGFEKIFRDYFEEQFAHRTYFVQGSVRRFFKIYKPASVIQHAYIDMNAIIVEVVRSALGKSKYAFDLDTFFATMNQQQDDSNPQIYPPLPSMQRITQICNKVVKIVGDFFAGVQPSKTFYLALDGPAQLAKLHTRRARSLDRIKQDGKHFDLGRDDFVSLLQVSPGTYFMYHLEVALNQWMQQQSALVPHVTFILNGSTTEGEGELKIVKHIHAQKLHDEVFYILSPDSDMYMSVLNCFQKPNIVIMRHQNGGCDIVFKYEILTVFRRYYSAKYLDRIVCDYTFMGLLYGSDFTNAQAYFANPYTLIDYYDAYVKQHKYTQFLIESSELGTTLNVAMLASMLGLYKTKHAPEAESMETLEKYLSSVVWVLDQYVHGECKNYMFECTRPHPYKPSTLYHLAQKHSTITVNHDKSNHPFSPILSTVMVHRHVSIMRNMFPPCMATLWYLEPELQTCFHDLTTEKFEHYFELISKCQAIIFKHGTELWKPLDFYALGVRLPTIYSKGLPAPMEDFQVAFVQPSSYEQFPQRKQILTFRAPRKNNQFKKPKLNTLKMVVNTAQPVPATSTTTTTNPTQ